jgi:hypothetical protein
MFLVSWLGSLYLLNQAVSSAVATFSFCSLPRRFELVVGAGVIIPAGFLAGSSHCGRWYTVAEVLCKL